MNNVILMGRLGKDLELKTNDKGSSTFGSIALDESYKNDKGEKVEKTVWVSFNLYGKIAENTVKYAGKKGNRLILMGKLDNFKGKDDKYAQLTFKPLNVQFVDFNDKKTQEENKEVPF